MYFSDKILLLTITEGQDSSGYPTKTEVGRDVWANKKSVARAEFYSANANGIRVTAVFDVHSEDFNDETELLFDSKRYEVLRAYQKGLGVVELNCTDKAV